MRRPVPVLLALATLLALLAGCGKHKDLLRPDVPPDTRIFVQGPVDTVNHVVHLYWFGTDPDGYVQGYEIRFRNPAAPADTQWVFTTVTDSVFAVFVPNGYSAPIFEVRAIDDAAVLAPADAAPGAPGGLRDPSPARQSFQFTNFPPVVRISDPFKFTAGLPVDTTFASATIHWTVTDPDNDLANARFRIWLRRPDGTYTDPDIVAGNSFTVPSARFTQMDGRTLFEGRTRLYIQAVDDGGMAGNKDSTEWNVRAAAGGSRHGRYGRLLIVDDTDPNYTFTTRFSDSLYANTAARMVPGAYSVLTMYPVNNANQPFRSARDVEQTLGLFDAVVWYVGGHTTFDAFETTLSNCQDGVGAYLDSGGNFYIDGLNLLDAYKARGVFTQSFAQHYLGIDSYLLQWNSSLVDSVGSWSTSGLNTAYVRFGFPGQPDSVVLRGSVSAGVRVCHVADASTGLMVAPVAAMSGPATEPSVIGVSKSQPSGGQAIVLTVPLSWTQPAPGDPVTMMNKRTPAILAAIFQQLGLGP